MNDDDDIDFNETQLDYCFQVSFCRLIGKQLLPTTIDVTTSIYLIGDDEDEIEFALTKMKHWIENYVAPAVVVSSMNGEGLSMLLDDANRPVLENPLMITPAEPSDHHLLYVFQSKLNALAEGVLEIIGLEITSSNAEGLSFCYVGDSTGRLPPMEEWIPGPNWFDVPWWERGDVSMIDSVAPEGADLSVIPVWASRLDHLRRHTSEQDAVVILAEWEPKIVGDDEK